MIRHLTKDVCALCPMRKAGYFLPRRHIYAYTTGIRPLLYSLALTHSERMGVHHVFRFAGSAAGDRNTEKNP